MALMSNLKNRLKQTYCYHLDLPENRHRGGVSYVYQCPKCKGYFGYYGPAGYTMRISQKAYEIFIKMTGGEQT